jgi:membrane associated rhomboid family serine protease
MSDTAVPQAPEAPTPRIPRVVAWGIALMAVVHFTQWTIVLPADVQDFLGFRREDLELGAWWRALTYPLAHPDFPLLLLNTYAFAFFGTRLERTWGRGRFVAFLTLATLGGWIGHLFIGGAGLLLGASSWALATAVAHAMQWGGEEHQLAGGLPIRGRWLAFFLCSLVLLSGLGADAGGGLAFLAHLGGIGAAWVFVRATPTTLVEKFRGGVSSLPDDPPEDQPPRAIPKTLPRSRARDRETIDDVVARTNAAPPTRRAPSARRRAEPQAPTTTAPPTVDAILDKILAEGLDQLTDEERRVLDDHSKKLRDR